MISRARSREISQKWWFIFFIYLSQFFSLWPMPWQSTEFWRSVSQTIERFSTGCPLRAKPKSSLCFIKVKYSSDVSLQWLYREVAWPRSGKVSILVFFDWSIKWRQMFSVNHKGNELRVVSKITYDKQLPGNLSFYSQSYSNHLCTVTDLNMLQQRYKERWW